MSTALGQVAEAPRTAEEAVAQAPPPIGRIDISERAVQKIAARAAAEVPDVGAPARRLLGRSVSVGSADLDGLPRVDADVDGKVVMLDLDVSVRWAQPVRAVTTSLRDHVSRRVEGMTGMHVAEVNIAVSDLVTQLPTTSRVR